MKKQFKILSLLVALVATFSFSSIMVQAVPVNQQLINNNRSYRSLNPIGIIIHDTCNAGATAQNNRDYFNRVYVGASAHYFVDWNGVIQTIPSNEQAWHAGGYANRNYLSIEMCNPKNGDQEAFEEVYKNTVELAAQICKEHGWNANANIYSHKYISDAYHQTDHQDPYAFLSQYGKSWSQLCNDIQRAINGQSINITSPKEESKPVDVKPSNGFTYANNAQIVNDLFYTRNENGDVVPGRVNIGDKVTILDVSYSKQLVKVQYPTPNGVKTAWIRNATNCISYFYKNQYKNGSTIENVYQNANLSSRIGNLSRYEAATVLYRENGKLHVLYSTDKGRLTKSGFVNWNDHFNKF
ncbi:N-acetylmuramoyl-L-alanine amidase [Clostridium cavendishii DSM 21758]|uniref:N-acetylmuramoyl-L-alanine amidase n=1 Tax=Clostridium cavendishii DSM 21758 TaxID=1121302 RepID=A0A1M6NVZ3_9CLOT|nr:peptidoglycan recognition family protein [Clostridium cavendishii]SHJ99853.1 N-acetylmuramoyl-L-alanine amidase [Clostridium cavendishii DSM 21758]